VNPRDTIRHRGVITPMDRIAINGLRVMTVVGVLPHEREAPQPLQIDLVLEADLHDAGHSDELADTANYGSVSEAVAAVVRDSKDLLLERVAARVAEVALAIERVEQVTVTVTKLRPPIPEDVTSTAITIVRHRRELDTPSRGAHTAVVALGSNLGDREEYLRFAVSQLGDVEAMSQVWETAPVGGPDGQGAYLNMVVTVRTHLDPYAFMRHGQRIEAAALRQRLVRWGPRTLDVDLLFHDDTRIDSPELTLPHPRFAERRFVLAPLAEVAPERCPGDWDATLPPDDVRPRGPLRT
jgi:dihydroneopterin aldolase/2-amino-4-hydroxy-6-hydroxymethyldihydropteridine diphosphokinase